MALARKITQAFYTPELLSMPLRPVLPLALWTPSSALQIVRGYTELMAIGTAELYLCFCGDVFIGQQNAALPFD
jgi:hypothetical protein